jgi:hypothetical protein
MDIHVDIDDGTDYQFISPGIYYIHILHYLLNHKNKLNIHSKSNRKIVERDKIDTPNTQIHDCSLFWLGTCNSITHALN